MIIIIGPPGAGKTVVGNSLAQDLGWQFLDTDIVIEDSTSLKIAQIFSLYGETSFRLLEKKLVETIFKQQLNEHSGTVIACGGGLPVPQENFDLLSQLGRIVSLTAEIDILAKRVAETKHRPLLNSSSDPFSQINKIKALVNQRKDIYAKANLSIDTSKSTVEAITQELKAKLKISQTA